MHASKPFVFAAVVTVAQSQAGIVSVIESEPASVSSVYSVLNAYDSSLTAGAAYQSLASDLPLLVAADPGYLGADGPAFSTAFTTYPSAVQAFLSSVEQAQESILQTTVAASAVTAFESSFTVELGAIESYLSDLTTQPGVESILSKLPPGLNFDESLDFFEPLIEKFGGALPDDVKSLLSNIVSFENSVQHLTVTAEYESGYVIAFPSTTVTEGTFVITPTATTGASVSGGGPAATGASSASSSAAAATGLGCGGSCRAMAGAMVGVALGAFAL